MSLLSDLKLGMEYAEKVAKNLEGSRHAYPEKYEKAWNNFLKARYLYVMELNEFYRIRDFGSTSIIFDTPSLI